MLVIGLLAVGLAIFVAGAFVYGVYNVAREIMQAILCRVTKNEEAGVFADHGLLSVIVVIILALWATHPMMFEGQTYPDDHGPAAHTAAWLMIVGGVLFLKLSVEFVFGFYEDVIDAIRGS